MSTICLAQEISHSNDTIFSKGIYLDNLKITIPWEINFYETNRYGNPTIEKFSQRYISVKWDSVVVLKNFRITLFIVAPKKFLKKNSLNKFASYRSLIDSTTAKGLISFFANYTGHSGYLGKNYIRWTLDNCRIFIGYGKFKEYFLEISRR